MGNSKEIITNRLKLRRINTSDIEAIAELANYPEISSFTMRMPYPSSQDFIRNWIEQDLAFNSDDSGFFVIHIKDSNVIIGVIGLEIDLKNENAELGYWLGINYWGQGFCTEAAKDILQYGFDKLMLNRIWTFYIEGNDSSKRVLEKIGMTYEGTFRKHIKKSGIFKDLFYYSKLKSD